MSGRTTMKATKEKNCNNCKNMGNRILCDFFWIDENEICDKYKVKEDVCSKDKQVQTE